MNFYNFYVTWDDIDCCMHCGWPGAKHSVDEPPVCPVTPDRAALAKLTAHIDACIMAMEEADE